MLALERLHLAFDGVPVLAGIDLTVKSGELVVLLGPSGCGKTSLLRLAAGVEAVQAGRVANRFARTAMVFQDPRLMPWADASDNAAFGLKALGAARAERRAAAQAILRRLGLGSADLGKRPAQLSGGMQQRVAIARAFALRPDLVLMDEPFSALDVGLRGDLQALLRAEVEGAGAAALFVTHDITEAVRLADRIVVLSPRPARVVADLPQKPIRPEAAPGAVFEAAAALLKRPEVAATLAAPVTAGAPLRNDPAVLPSLGRPAAAR
ncbi:ABC transporter related [Xanthobacter versatilis]|uniref:ABC transporter related n=1 Tax=Xanthobacter autotrophicus (strain ATCC BAA-1158 / Py2) TaxID=78245 RepID=A7IML7_XANP2|nr:ABC transporter related [Xanthobacter autotrophicus Py2]